MSTPSLIKQPSESRLFEMSFVPRLLPDETLLAVNSITVDKDGLTLSGSPTLGSTSVFQRISGGDAGVRYKVTFRVTTSLSNDLEAEGILQVEDN